MNSRVACILTVIAAIIWLNVGDVAWEPGGNDFGWPFFAIRFQRHPFRSRWIVFPARVAWDIVIGMSIVLAAFWQLKQRVNSDAVLRVRHLLGITAVFAFYCSKWCVAPSTMWVGGRHFLLQYVGELAVSATILGLYLAMNGVIFTLRQSLRRLGILKAHGRSSVCPLGRALFCISLIMLSIGWLSVEPAGWFYFETDDMTYGIDDSLGWPFLFRDDNGFYPGGLVLDLGVLMFLSIGPVVRSFGRETSIDAYEVAGFVLFIAAAVTHCLAEWPDAWESNPVAHQRHSIAVFVIATSLWNTCQVLCVQIGAMLSREQSSPD